MLKIVFTFVFPQPRENEFSRFIMTESQFTFFVLY